MPSSLRSLQHFILPPNISIVADNARRPSASVTASKATNKVGDEDLPPLRFYKGTIRKNQRQTESPFTSKCETYTTAINNKPAKSNRRASLDSNSTMNPRTPTTMLRTRGPREEGTTPSSGLGAAASASLVADQDDSSSITAGTIRRRPRISRHCTPRRAHSSDDVLLLLQQQLGMDKNHDDSLSFQGLDDIFHSDKSSSADQEPRRPRRRNSDSFSTLGDSSLELMKM